MEAPGVAQVFLFALLTAVATGLGALPFLLAKHPTRGWLGVSNALAGGLMLAASFGLVYEGVAYSLWRALLGVVLGLDFIMLTRTLLQHEEHPVVFEHGRLRRSQGAAHRRGDDAALVHGGGQGFGLFITLVIAVHNIPEGLAISLVLVPRGVGVGRAALWSVFSSLPQPLMAVPAFLFVALFEPLLPIGLGFAGGAMIWMVFSELVPDALEETRSNLVAVVVTLAVAAMVAFQFLIK